MSRQLSLFGEAPPPPRHAVDVVRMERDTACAYCGRVLLFAEFAVKHLRGVVHPACDLDQRRATREAGRR